RFRATGQLTVNLLNFVSGHVGFTFETKTVNAHAPGGDLTGASLALITLTVNDLFVGAPGGVGFQLSSGSVAIATLKPAVSDGRSWLSVSASLSGGSFAGVPRLTLTL